MSIFTLTDVRTCDIDDCDKPYRARGLCVTHYNKQHQPDRHRKAIVKCSYCGELCDKEPTSKYAERFCSLICRDLARLERCDGDPMRAARLARVHQPTRCPIPAEHPARWFGDASTPVTFRDCAWCGGLYTAGPSRALRAYCSACCKRKAKRMRRRANEHTMCFGEWSWSDFMHVARRFGYCCAYCGMKPTRLDPDHVVPVSRGGPNIIGNLLPACADCNADKRDCLLTEWDADRAARGLLPLRSSWAHEDTRYWHLAVQIAA